MLKSCNFCGYFVKTDFCSIKCMENDRVDLVVSDGGTIGKNGDAKGVTWAYVLVNKHGKIIKQESGFDLRLKTSPQAEALALINALDNLPEGWEGKVMSDCEWALKAVFKIWNVKKLDIHLKHRRDKLKLGKVKIVLIKGHPNKVDLENGYTKDGRPVSEYNVLCDKLCNEERQKFEST